MKRRLILICCGLTLMPLDGWLRAVGALVLAAGAAGSLRWGEKKPPYTCPVAARDCGVGISGLPLGCLAQDNALSRLQCHVSGGAMPQEKIVKPRPELRARFFVTNLP